LHRELFRPNRSQIKKGIETYIPSNNRSQVLEKGSNILIMDAYNANPSSMEVALSNFATYPGENKILILGEMLELGNDSSAEHEKLLNQIKNEGFREVYLVGPGFQAYQDFYKFHFFNGTGDLVEFLTSHKLKNANILIKGSRKNQLEKVLEALS